MARSAFQSGKFNYRADFRYGKWTFFFFFKAFCFANANVAVRCETLRHVSFARGRGVRIERVPRTRCRRYFFFIYYTSDETRRFTRSTRRPRFSRKQFKTHVGDGQLRRRTISLSSESRAKRDFHGFARPPTVRRSHRCGAAPNGARSVRNVRRWVAGKNVKSHSSRTGRVRSGRVR